NGTSSTTFSVAAGVETIAATDAIAGEGGFTKSGAGALVLASADSYAGGTILDAGTLDLAAAGAAGTGAISFAGTAKLKIENPAWIHHAFGNAIDFFGAHDVLDFTGLRFHAGATATYHPRSHVLIVRSGHVIDAVRLFSPEGTHFVTANDGHHGTKVMLAP